MADNTVVHMGENSPEYIAYKLLTDIANVEGKALHRGANGRETADRKWILETYTECLEAAKGYRQKPTMWPSQG